MNLPHLYPYSPLPNFFVHSFEGQNMSPLTRLPWQPRDAPPALEPWEPLLSGAPSPCCLPRTTEGCGHPQKPREKEDQRAFLSFEWRWISEIEEKFLKGDGGGRAERRWDFLGLTVLGGKLGFELFVRWDGYSPLPLSPAASLLPNPPSFSPFPHSLPLSLFLSLYVVVEGGCERVDVNERWGRPQMEQEKPRLPGPLSVTL